MRDDDGLNNNNSSKCSVMWDYSECYPDPVCAQYGFKYRVNPTASTGSGGGKGKKRSCKDEGDNDESVAKKRKPESLSKASAIQWLDEQ
jgi:hypothetical protein